MIIEKNLVKQPVPPTISLAYKNGRVIGNLIYEETSLTVKVELEDNYILLSEMSCDIHKYLNNKIVPYWDEIKNFKLLYVPIEIPHISSKGFWYEITVTIDDADSTIKHITGTLAQYAELDHVNNYDVEIRTQNDIDRDDYVDAVFYDPNDPEASILNRVLKDKASHYSIHHVDTSLYNVKRTFSFSGQSVLECLKDICKEVDCIMIFGENESSDHVFHRTISFYDAKDYCPACGKRGDFTNGCTNPECEHNEDIIPRYGEDTGLFINKDNLGEEINLETNIDDIINCYRLTAGDDDMTAAVINCNPSGSRYIWHFTDDMKKDMSPELRTKINDYETAMNMYKTSYQMNNISQSQINSYNSYVNTYQDYSSEDLNTITYPVTGYVNLIRTYYYVSYLYDFLNTIMMPFSPEVDDTTAQEQMALFTPTTIGTKGLASITKTTSATEIKELVKVYIDTSRYKIDVVTTTYSKPTWTGTIKLTSYTDEEDTYEITKTLTFTEATDTYIKTQMDKLLKKHETSITGITSLINASTNDFVTEINKYNLMALNNIYAVIDAVLKIMDDAEVTQSSDPDVYSQYYAPLLAKKNAMGSVITGRETEVGVLKNLLDSIDEQKTDINNILVLEDYLGVNLWSELVLFRREGDLTNTSFISVGMNDKEIIDNAMDFYDRAVEDIEKQAELQYTISSDLKNFLLMPNEVYDNYALVFDVGNWMRIEVDEKIYKLRLVEYEIDFDDLTTINVEFTDCKKSNDITSQFAEYRKTVNSVKKETASIKKEIVDVQEETHIFVDAVSESAITSDAIIVEDTGETLTEHLRSTATDNAINIDNAKKVATNYLSLDSTGVMVADLTDGQQTPSTATGRNVKIDNDSVDIRNGQDVLASFGENTLIGAEENSKIQLSSGGIVGLDNQGGQTFEISNNGVSQDNSFIINSIYHTLDFSDANVSRPSVFIYTIQQTIKNGSDISMKYKFTNGQSTVIAPVTSFTYGTASTKTINNNYTAGSINYNGDKTFTISMYKTIPTISGIFRFYLDTVSFTGTKMTPYFTFGTRIGDIGSWSFAEGEKVVASGRASHAEGQVSYAKGDYSHAEGCETEAYGNYSHAQNKGTVAKSAYQTVLGKYNVIDSNNKYVAIIGNGEGRIVIEETIDDQGNVSYEEYDLSSNALAVTWDGNIEMALDTSAATGTTDGDLYTTITALGWGNNVFSTLMLSIKNILTSILQYLLPVETSLSPDSALSGTDHHVCKIIKKGKSIRAYISVGYNDTSTGIATDTTFFTIPENYRPKTDITCPASAWLTNGTPRLAYFTIYSETGIITQRSSSSISQICGAIEWTI